MTDFVLVLTTVPLTDRGTAIARTLVEERLAACVSALPPMTSVYRWQGDVTEDSEQQLIIKTTRSQVPALERRVRELHPYDVPEFLVVEISGGAGSYLDWIGDSVS
ncbi:MAG: divalent-cation tolerance protein CutA [Vicinamibacterales bacterium]